jgi:hypothetical protein
MAKVKEKAELKITKEICDKVIYLDLRIDGNARRLMKSLKKLPIVKEDNNLTTDEIEVVIKKIERKFKIHLAYIQRSVIDCEDHYSGMIKHDTGTWICTIYAQTIWEVYAKALFFMYFYIEDERRKNNNRKVKY